MTGGSAVPERPVEAWTLFDQKRMCAYGGKFGSEFEAWQAHNGQCRKRRSA